MCWNRYKVPAYFAYRFLGGDDNVARIIVTVGVDVDRPARPLSSAEADLHIGCAATAKPPLPGLLHPTADILRQGRAVRGIASAEADHSHARSVHSGLHMVVCEVA